MNENPLKDIDPKQLHDCTGIGITFVNQIKRGARKLPVDYCPVVAKAFGIPPEILRPDKAKFFQDMKVFYGCDN